VETLNHSKVEFGLEELFARPLLQIFVFVLTFVLTAAFFMYCFASSDINKPDDDEHKAMHLVTSDQDNSAKSKVIPQHGIIISMFYLEMITDPVIWTSCINI